MVQVKLYLLAIEFKLGHSLGDFECSLVILSQAGLTVEHPVGR